MAHSKAKFHPDGYRTAYDRWYDIPGTLEHDAHKIIEVYLKKKYFSTYFPAESL